MHDLNVFVKYHNKIVDALDMMALKPLMLIPIFTLPLLTTTEKTLLFLGFLFVADFITGVAASWVEFRKSLPVLPGSGKRYVFSSSKMRLSGVKFITYGMGIVTAYALECIFLIKEFEPEALATQKLTLTTIVTLFFCTIEFYSIFFENIKRMGFDIIQKVKTITKAGWGLYKDVKDENKSE